MSKLHNEYKEYQKRFDKHKESGSEKEESGAGLNQEAPSMKRRSSKEKPLRRIKSGPARSGENNRAADVPDKGGIMRKKVSMLLGEIGEIRNIQRRLVEENEGNKTQLEEAKKSIEGYSEKIKELGELEKSLNESKERCDALEEELEEKDKIIEKLKAISQSGAVDSNEAETLKSENERMKEKISGMEKQLEHERRKVEETKEYFMKRPPKSGTEDISDIQMRKIEFLESEVKRREGVIEELLGKRKINPEHERLMIVWLSAAVAEERKRNSELKEKIEKLQKKIPKESETRDGGY